jgi:Flp pilus assembly protein TadD
VRSIALVIAATILPIALLIPNACIAGGAEQVCDVNADYSLGVEDYSEAIRLHVGILRKQPDNALAHYHLGVALGMVGYKTAEIKEYHRAAALGLKSWDLFLNLGLASLENGDLDAAADSLRRAVLLGEDHSESHFNLALVDEQRGMLAEAEHEALASLLLNPGQPDARNLLAVIHAREGETSLAWSELVHDAPDYQSARANLAILGGRRAAANGEPAAVDLPPATAGKTIADERELNSPTDEAFQRPSPAH